MMTSTFSTKTRIQNKVFYLILMSLSLIILVLSQGLSAQTAQGMSAEELQKINQQPIAKQIKNNAETGKSSDKKPTFEHQETDGTHIKEFKEGGKATEVIVESPMGTRYELSTPNDAASPQIRDQNVNRVPTIRMPF